MAIFNSYVKLPEGTIINQPVETRAETEPKASSISDDITVFLSNSSEVALCLEVKGSPKPFVNFHPENVFQKRPEFQ